MGSWHPHSPRRAALQELHALGGPDLYSIKGAHPIRGSHAPPRLAHAASLGLPQKPTPSLRAALGTPHQCAQLLDSERCP